MILSKQFSSFFILQFFYFRNFYTKFYNYVQLFYNFLYYVI